MSAYEPWGTVDFDAINKNSAELGRQTGVNSRSLGSSSANQNFHLRNPSVGAGDDINDSAIVHSPEATSSSSDNEPAEEVGLCGPEGNLQQWLQSKSQG